MWWIPEGGGGQLLPSRAAQTGGQVCGLRNQIGDNPGKYPHIDYSQRAEARREDDKTNRSCNSDSASAARSDQDPDSTVRARSVRCGARPALVGTDRLDRSGNSKAALDRHPELLEMAATMSRTDRAESLPSLPARRRCAAVRAQHFGEDLGIGELGRLLSGPRPTIPSVALDTGVALKARPRCRRNCGVAVGGPSDTSPFAAVPEHRNEVRLHARPPPDRPPVTGVGVVEHSTSTLDSAGSARAVGVVDCIFTCAAWSPVSCTATGHLARVLYRPGTSRCCCESLPVTAGAPGIWRGRHERRSKLTSCSRVFDHALGGR